MAGKMIGVEIGNDTVKLSYVSGGVVKTIASERLPENLMLDGKIASPDAMSEIIRDLRKENKIPGGNAALVLPYRAVITNSFSMPPMSDAELKLNLPFEFRDFVGQDGAKYHYDYAVMDTVTDDSGKPEKLEIFAAAVRKDVIEKSYNLLKKAGLTLKVAVPHEMAWLNLVRSTDAEPKELCIVDIGRSSTRLYIFSEGKFMMGREIEIGGQLLDEIISAEVKVDTHVARTYKESNMNEVLVMDPCLEAYNNLGVEIMRAVNFYNAYGNRGGYLQDLYFCGGMSNIEPLRTAIKKATGMTVHNISRLVPGGVASGDTLVTALASGAAIQ